MQNNVEFPYVKKKSEFVFPDNKFSSKIYFFFNIEHVVIYFARQAVHIGKSCESGDILEHFQMQIFVVKNVRNK